MRNHAKDDGSPSGSGSDALTWLGDYPVIRNKTVAISILAVTTISFGLVAMLLIGISMEPGQYDSVGEMAAVMGGIWLGFTALMFLIGKVFFGGRMPVEVAIDGRGITQIQRSKRAKAANTVAMIAGALAGGARGMTTAGAGALAASRAVERFEYRSLREAKGNPETGEIRLWDDWHTVMQVFAPPDKYEEAMRRLRQGIAAAGSRRHPLADIPMAARVLVCLGAVVFGAFLLADFPLAYGWLYVAAMVLLAVATIVSRPSRRPLLGWILAGGVAVSVAFVFKMQPPVLSEKGAGIVLGIQLGSIGLFALFGVCAGLGVFNLRQENP